MITQNIIYRLYIIIVYTSCQTFFLLLILWHNVSYLFKKIHLHCSYLCWFSFLLVGFDICIYICMYGILCHIYFKKNTFILFLFMLIFLSFGRFWYLHIYLCIYACICWWVILGEWKNICILFQLINNLIFFNMIKI